MRYYLNIKDCSRFTDTLQLNNNSFAIKHYMPNILTIVGIHPKFIKVDTLKMAQPLSLLRINYCRKLNFHQHDFINAYSTSILKTKFN